MKVLIWLGCLILNFVLQSVARALVLCFPASDNISTLLIGLLNGLLSAASIGFCIWLAIKLCKKVDWQRVEKKALDAGMSVSDYGKHGLSEKFLSKLEILCETLPYEQVKPQLKACVRSGKITKDQYIILLEEYCKKK